MRTQGDSPQDKSYTFQITFAELKTLCGIMRMKESVENTFLNDNNLVVDETSITIKSRKKLEDQIAYYRAKSGQIISVTK